MLNKQLEAMTKLSTASLKELRITTLEHIRNDEGDMDENFEQLELVRDALIMRGIM